jgi:hypothetical protein
MGTEASGLSRAGLSLLVRSGSELGVRDSALVLRQRPSPRPVASDDETVGSAGERASQERELADRS